MLLNHLPAPSFRSSSVLVLFPLYLFIFEVNFMHFFKVVPLQALHSSSTAPDKLMCGCTQAHAWKSVLSILSPSCLVHHCHDFNSLHLKNETKPKRQTNKTTGGKKPNNKNQSLTLKKKNHPTTPKKQFKPPDTQVFVDQKEYRHLKGSERLCSSTVKQSQH